jgi:hypothetical protein
MKKILLISFVVASVFFLNSCKKNKNTYDNSNAPKTNAIIENAFDEMTNMTDQAITGNMIFYKSGKVTVYDLASAENMVVEKAACSVIITIDTLSSPKSVTIDWGNTNCDCNDGKQRRGKIITTFTGSYYAQGTVITHTPVDYFVNNHKLEGTKTITNMGANANGQPYYNVQINGVATLATGEVVNYTSSRVRTFTAGYNTQLNFWDDEYDITGTANATVVNGDGYQAQTTAPLHIKVGCGYITKGTLEITPTGKPVRVIDYGSGTCDGTFTITVNGNTYTING